MNTRKRNYKITKTEQQQDMLTTKMSRTKITTRTNIIDPGRTSDENETDTNNTTMNDDDTLMATGPVELSDNDSCDTEILNTSSDEMSAQTNEMLREADVLIAEIAEFQRDMNHNLNHSGQTITISDNNDSITDTASTSVERQTASQMVSTSGASTSNNPNTSANDSRENNTIDDSVVIIDDPNTSMVRPITIGDDDDVIFVNESRKEHRTIAMIDLCDTTNSSIETKSTTQASFIPSKSTNSLPDKSTQSCPGSIRCPICLDSYGFNEILSTICGHLFCDPCIRNIIKIRKKCPLCNKGLKPNQVHRIFLDT